jgi:L-ascorbate metabolism protein UlaG (beta-lactamase superfamily)
LPLTVDEIDSLAAFPHGLTLPSPKVTLEGRNMLDTRFTAVDSSHWTITREKTNIGEVTRDQHGTFMLSPAPGRVFLSGELDSISAFMNTEQIRDAATLLPN